MNKKNKMMTAKNGVVCSHCKGTGRVKGVNDKMKLCPVCKGAAMRGAYSTK